MKAKIFLRPETNLRKASMKYGRLVVFISHDSAEIWGVRYGLKLVIGTLKLWPAPVFSCVWFVLSNNLLNKATTTKRWAQREIFTRGGNAKIKQNANRE
jgi:hypothetical protein